MVTTSPRTAQPAPVGHPTGTTPGTGNATQGPGIKAPNGGAIDVRSHVIAGRNGNYYRPDGVGGWQEMKKPMAQNVSGQTPPAQHQKPSSPPAGSWQPYKGGQTGVLNRELSSRELGAQRQSSFQAHQPQFSNSGGGTKPQQPQKPQPQKPR
jgi:hypothetical protein